MEDGKGGGGMANRPENLIIRLLEVNQWDPKEQNVHPGPQLCCEELDARSSAKANRKRGAKSVQPAKGRTIAADRDSKVTWTRHRSGPVVP